jgi:hypothetical protein
MRIGYTLTGPGEGIDATFAALARRLAAQGLRVTGAVQHTARDAAGRLSAMELHLLPEGTALNLAQDLGAGARGCRLDPGALEQAVHALSARLAAGADLLIVPRFGEREAAGGGFRGLIAEAAGGDVPVLVGVSAAWAAAFADFAGADAERVAASADALDGWAARALAMPDGAGRDAARRDGSPA